jgi:hypothetical protein
MLIYKGNMWKNLAPALIRQRVIIEGTTEKIVGPEEIREYLLKLADVTDMERISGPYVYSAHEMGFGGWIHWKTSGATFYSYPTNPSIFTVDCYTCKPFSLNEATEFTKTHFRVLDIVSKEIEV